MAFASEPPGLAPLGDAPPRLAYRKAEVGRLIGVSGRTVDRLIARGLLKPDVRIGRLKLWSHAGLVRWLERGVR